MGNPICYKYYLLAFNVASLVLAMATVTISFYIRYERDLKDYIIELGAYQFWTGPFILIAAGLIAMIASLFGCWATVIESSFFLSIYGAAELISAILNLSGATYTICMGTWYSNPMTEWLDDRFYQLIYDSPYNERSARILRRVQEEVGCCGADSEKDYIDVNMILPTECRDPATGNMNDFGCTETFMRFMEPMTGWLTGVALALCALQIIAIVVIWLLRKAIKKADKHIDNKTYVAVRTSKT